MKIKTWQLALLISAGILIMILIFLPTPKDTRFVEIEGMTCDQMLEHYDYCVSHIAKPMWKPEWDVTKECRDYYLQNIIDCYGEDLLRDQLALINSSDING